MVWATRRAASGRTPRRAIPVSILRWTPRVLPELAARAPSSRARNSECTPTSIPCESMSGNSLSMTVPRTRRGVVIPCPLNSRASPLSPTPMRAIPSSSQILAVALAPWP